MQTRRAQPHPVKKKVVFLEMLFDLKTNLIHFSDRLGGFKTLRVDGLFQPNCIRLHRRKLLTETRDIAVHAYGRKRWMDGYFTSVETYKSIGVIFKNFKIS